MTKLLFPILLVTLWLPAALADDGAVTPPPAEEDAAIAAPLLDLLMSTAEPALSVQPEENRLNLAGSCATDGVCVFGCYPYPDTDCLCEPHIDCGLDRECPGGYCDQEWFVCFCV